MLIYCSLDGSHDENVIGKAMTYAKVGRHPWHFELTQFVTVQLTTHAVVGLLS
jgi:hypothetical protein